jgi:hypothetical protein
MNEENQQQLQLWKATLPLFYHETDIYFFSIIDNEKK